MNRLNPILSLLAIGLTLAGCGGGTPLEDDDSRPKPADYPIHGVDVSKYQGDVDWDQLARGGVQFAWIKATEGGDHVDPKFADNWEGAKRAGIPRGAYHFVYWCRPPLEEARWFEENAPVEADALPPVLDVEPTPDSKTCHRQLEPAEAQADMRVMLTELERHYGKKPIIYTSVDFYRAILADGAFADYPLWVRSTKRHPTGPYGSRPWTIWQYQADGHLDGVDGHVDRNAFNGTRAQWQAFLAAK